jgi:NAD(P)-dependent dehydrogenase (short-subunit alcohol dehydrogenase family)
MSITTTRSGFIAIQALVRHASPGATLISIVTTLAHSAFYLGFSSYGASKLATLKVMQDVHEEHPEY